jgi:hypothetical protein
VPIVAIARAITPMAMHAVVKVRRIAPWASPFVPPVESSLGRHCTA